MLGFTVLVMNDKSQESIIARWHIHPEVGTSQRLGQKTTTWLEICRMLRIQLCDFATPHPSGIVSDVDDRTHIFTWVVPPTNRAALLLLRPSF